MFPPLYPGRVTAQLASQLQDALGSDYRVEQELAGGGMSRLFIATDLRHDRRVVVKVLSPELVSTESTARFKREIELTVRLQHPHILPILTSGSWEDVLYYITPFIPGESLKARIEREKKLPLDDVVKILRDASGALAFAHQRGIVHRDVKPGNILLAEGHAILADFGIARAMATNATPLTGSGMAPGTPAYMAPELPTDERADVYALGVVAYEMLCGSLPKRGMTTKDIVAARGRVDGDSPSRLHDLATLIADAFSASPERRTSSVAEFVGRLDEVPAIHSRWRVTVVAGVAAAAAIIAGGAYAASTLLHPALNANRFVVLALGTPAALKTELTARVTDAVSEWQGLELADPNAVSVAVQKRARASLAYQDGTAIGRGLKARNFVGVDVSGDGDSIVVRASLYDASRDTAIKSRRVAFGKTDDAAARRMIMRRLVNSLVRDGDEMPWRSASDRETPSINAWRAYDAGRSAIQKWDLPAAESSFKSAVAGEARLSLAHLWLAQTQVWEAGSRLPDEVRATIRRAMEGRPALAGRDSIYAAALALTTEYRFDRACDDYRSLIARDSSDLTAWLGLGDCQNRDRAIVRGRNNTVAFRGSWEGAARAYQRANEIGPTGPDGQFRGWLLGRLSTVLYTVANKVRAGRLIGPDSVSLAAFPYIDHDSLAFSPITMAELSKGVGSPEPAKIEAAVARNRALLRSAAEEWVRRSPKSAAAYDSLAAWTEVSGGVATIAEQQVPTIEIVNHALRFATDSTQRLRLGVARVRLLVKDGKFASARHEADSLLAAGAATRVGVVSGVSGLAALTGHVESTVALWAAAPNGRAVQASDGRIVTFPKQIGDAVARLTVYTAFGIQEDSIRASTRALIDLLPTYFPDSATAVKLRATILPTALSFAYPASASLLAAEQEGPDQTANAMRSLAVGDSAGARTRLENLRRLGSGRSTGLSVDATYRRALLAVALGDTAAAIRGLDPILKALPTLVPTLLDRVSETTSLVRALALRAELAQHDRETARSCARAVVELWSNADPALRPVVDRMNAIAH